MTKGTQDGDFSLMQRVAEKLGWVNGYHHKEEERSVFTGSLVPFNFIGTSVKECCKIRFAAWVKATLEKRGAFYNTGIVFSSPPSPHVVLGGFTGKDDACETYDPRDPFSECDAILRCADRMLENVPEPGQQTRETYSLMTTLGMDSLIGRGLSDLAGHEQCLDIESWLVYLGAALGLIPKGMRDWKALIYCSPAVCDVLHDIVQLLIDRRVLVLNYVDQTEELYRLPKPEERWAAKMNSAGHYQLLMEEELSPNEGDSNTLVFIVDTFIGEDVVRRHHIARLAYPVQPTPVQDRGNKC